MGQIWFERILRWRKKAQRFLQGRYARFDELNRTLLLTSVVLALINIFTGYLWVRLLILITVAYVYYRFFSKHIHSRLNENQRFILRKQRLMQKVHAFRKRKSIVILNVQNVSSHYVRRKDEEQSKSLVQTAKINLSKKSDLLCFLV
jgi:hypothetical protein